MTLKAGPGRKALFVLLLSMVVASGAAAELIGYTGDGNTVTELLLHQAGNGLPEGESWTFSGIGSVRSIERDESGLLYLTTWSPIVETRLFTADLDTGESTELWQFGLLGNTDLAFDESGVLWIVTLDGTLYTYDPESHTLSWIIDIPTIEPVRGIAWARGLTVCALRTCEPRARSRARSGGYIRR